MIVYVFAESCKSSFFHIVLIYISICDKQLCDLLIAGEIDYSVLIDRHLKIRTTTTVITCGRVLFSHLIRLYKLLDKKCEPITMTVPRKVSLTHPSIMVFMLCCVWLWQWCKMKISVLYFIETEILDLSHHTSIWLLKTQTRINLCRCSFIWIQFSWMENH